MFDLNFFIAASSGLLIGMSKAGIKGIGILFVTLIALVYGAKESTGIIMPLLILGDIFAVIYYKRHTKWIYILKFLPWMIFGVLVAVFIGKDIPESIFKILMAIIIISSVFLMWVWDSMKYQKIPTHWSFSTIMGSLAGITTMIGNLAGPFANIYFLAVRIPKNEFIGTSAWLFFLINIFKVPFHVLSWKTINFDSLNISLSLTPYVIIGLILGVKIVEKINNDSYRKLILIFTALGGLGILIK